MTPPTVPPIIDIGILTIREDEFQAVLNVFPDDHGIHKSRHREYTLRTADAGEGPRFRLAILRQTEQGNGEAQDDGPGAECRWLRCPPTQTQEGWFARR